MNARGTNVAAGGVMMVAFAVVLGALFVLDRDDTPADTESTLSDPGADVILRGGGAVAGFLGEFERSTEATFRIVAELTREVENGASITNRFVVAQRPPRQFTRSISGTEVGSIISDDQLTEATELVTGEASMYTVVGTSDGCWRLVLREFVPASPLGTTTEYCFDGETGAPTYVRTARAEGTDTMIAVEVTGVVTDADLG